MPVTALRASLTAAIAAVALAIPAVPASSTPTSPFHIQNVSVTADPNDLYHPIVSYRLACSLPPDSPLRSGQTQNTTVNLLQTDGDNTRSWFLHGPFEVPRPYTCGETVTVQLRNDLPDGSIVSDGVARVFIREVISVDGSLVEETYNRQVMVRIAQS